MPERNGKSPLSSPSAQYRRTSLSALRSEKLHAPMKRHAYTHLTEEEYQQLDELIRHQGFTTRTAYLTAVARVTLYGWQTKYHLPSGELDPVTAAWITWHKSRVTAEDQLRQTYFDILNDLAFPVIAARGAQLAFHLLRDEIETAMAERTGIVPSFDCMKTWTQVYETIHAEELGRHRADLTRDAARDTDLLRQQEEPCKERGDRVYE